MENAFRFLAPLPKLWVAFFTDTWIGKIIAAAFAGALEYLFPIETGRAMAVGAMSLILVDTLTGWYAATVAGNKITSAKFSRVLTKILGYGSIVIVAAVAAHTLPGTQDYQHVAVSGVVGFVIVTEGISILENVAKMGLASPPWLKKWLKERLKDKPDGKE